ncbi:MAG: SDR family NAD(P)-dependent oxidoreductase [Nitriliruptorales bacterium]|nr:SDR family NAD(P)-dependent oxidoreductase [Nitriliruptorales bacterium]
MKILVTGATGFLGSHLVGALQRRGHEVRVLVRSPDKLPTILENLGVEPATVEVVAGDMTDEAAVKQALDGVDGVVHTAASTALGVADGSTNDINVEGVRQVIGQAVALGLDPIVHASSMAAYVPTDAEIITADSPLAEPDTAYGRSKRAGEELVRGWQDEGAAITTIILGSIYGPDSPHLEGGFLAVRAALELMMVVAEGGMGILDVRDGAELFAAATEPGKGPRILLAGGHWVTWQQWVDLLSEAVGREVPSMTATHEQMLEMGRQLDAQRAAGEDVDLPLSEEAALTIAQGRHLDDAATLAELGITWRPTLETLRDAAAWLVSAGHLDPALAPALARAR